MPAESLLRWFFAKPTSIALVFLSTVGVPVLNQAYRHSGPKFVEHCALVFLVCRVVLLLFFLMRLGCYKLGLAAGKLSAEFHDGVLTKM